MIPLADMAMKLIALNGCAYGVMALGNAWIGVQWSVCIALGFLQLQEHRRLDIVTRAIVLH